MQKAVTRDISVSVETRFLDSDSDPDEAYFVWAYRITIENLGDERVQLLTRHWQIPTVKAACKKCAARALSASNRPSPRVKNLPIPRAHPLQRLPGLCAAAMA